MRKILISIMALMVLVVAGCSKDKSEETLENKHALSMKIDEKSQDITLSFLPEHTEFMLKIGSLANVCTYFHLSEASESTVPLDQQNKLKEQIGFNPFNLEEVKSNGFDPDKEFGFAVADITVDADDNELDFNLLVFIPVIDGEKAVTTIQDAIQKKSPNLKIKKDGKLTIFENGEAPQTLYLTLKDKYLLMAVNAESDINVKPFLETALTGDHTLGNVKYYQEVISKIEPGEEIFAYLNLKSIVERNLESIKKMMQANLSGKGATDLGANLSYLVDCEGAGLSVDLEGIDFVMKTVANFIPEAKSLKAFKDIRVDRNIILGLKENPVFLLSFAVSLQQYYKMIMENLSETEADNLKTWLEMVKLNFDINFEQEIINNIAGNFNMAVYDGAGINLMNYNTLLTLNIQDESSIKNVIEKLIVKLPPEQQAMLNKEKIGDIDTYILMAGPTQIFMGLKDRNLIFAVGRSMFEKAINGNVSSGFTLSMTDKELVEKINSSSTLFYLNIDEAFKIFKNFEMMVKGFTGGKGIDGKIQEALNQFVYLIISGKIENESILSDFVIKTKFTEPFFTGVEKLFTQLKQRHPSESVGAPQSL